MEDIEALHKRLRGDLPDMRQFIKKERKRKHARYLKRRRHMMKRNKIAERISG